MSCIHTHTHTHLNNISLQIYESSFLTIIYNVYIQKHYINLNKKTFKNPALQIYTSNIPLLNLLFYTVWRYSSQGDVSLLCNVWYLFVFWSNRAMCQQTLCSRSLAAGRTTPSPHLSRRVKAASMHTVQTVTLGYARPVGGKHLHKRVTPGCFLPPSRLLLLSRARQLSGRRDRVSLSSIPIVPAQVRWRITLFCLHNSACLH